MFYLRSAMIPRELKYTVEFFKEIIDFFRVIFVRTIRQLAYKEKYLHKLNKVRGVFPLLVEKNSI